MYRVWRKVVTANKEHVQVVWQGSNLATLRTKYPVPSLSTPLVFDLLVPYVCLEGEKELCHWWEVTVDGGDWKQCRDPRYSRQIL